MADTLNHPLFVEFYGLPGCGKSTVSHLLASRLRNEGYLVDEPSYDIDHNNSPIIKKLKKICIYFIWFAYHNKIFKKVNAIVGGNGYSGLAKIQQTSNVLQKVSVYRVIRQNKIVIWDQGLVQASISLSLNGKINAGDNLKSLSHLLFSEVKVLKVLISVNEMVALERMSQRPSNYSRVEKLKDEYLKRQMLQRFQEEIDNIGIRFPGVVVNGEIEEVSLARLIFKEVKDAIS
jgi:thymidylate kinase